MLAIFSPPFSFPPPFFSPFFPLFPISFLLHACLATSMLEHFPRFWDLGNALLRRYPLFLPEGLDHVTFSIHIAKMRHN